MRKRIHSTIYFVGLLLIAFFMPLSLFVTNASILLIVANWFVEGGYACKLERLKENKGVLIFCAIFVVHLLWLVNTSNFAYAANDLRIKLPLLALPIAIGTSEAISKKKLNIALLVFVSGVTAATLIGFFAKFFENGTNYRSLSLFVSHIRLSLMICFSLFILGYFVAKKIFFTGKKVLIALAIAAFLLFFMVMLQALTGFICLFVTLVIVLVAVSVKTKQKKIRGVCIASVVVVFIMAGGFIAYVVYDFYRPTAENVQLETTAQGRPYDEVLENGLIENGNVVNMNICRAELEETWPQHSSIPLDGLDRRGQYVYSTLLRYMTSRGLTKDAEGLSHLSDADIANIENGETNYRFSRHGDMLSRMYVIMWELDVYAKTGDSNGHSFTQRIEYMKYGLKLAKRNFWTGTGEGDVNDEYQAIYEEENSNLNPEWRNRAHNQFLTFFIAFGLFGFLICLSAWFYPAFSKWNSNGSIYYFMVFFIIATVSMFSDDTLETSTGAVFVSFFYALLRWASTTKLENQNGE